MRKTLAAIAAALTVTAAAPATAATPNGAGDTQIVFASKTTTYHACTGRVTTPHPWMMTLQWRPSGTTGKVDYAFTDNAGRLIAGGHKTGHGTWNIAASMLKANARYQLCVTLVNPGKATLYGWRRG